MLVRRLVVLSGFDSRVSAAMRSSLESRQTDVAFVKLGSVADADYFRRLSSRALEILSKHSKYKNQIIYGALVSCCHYENESILEEREFFPSFRRILVDKNRRRDINKSRETADFIMSKLVEENFKLLQKHMKHNGDCRLLLPTENSNSSKILKEFLSLYRMDTFEPSSRLAREAVKMRKGRGIRVRGVDFSETVNGSDHPIRRCSESSACDLHSILRFGFQVPERFEFDVTCETGLAGKTFRLCNGDALPISRSASHLNMRINGDFREGSKG